MEAAGLKPCRLHPPWCQIANSDEKPQTSKHPPLIRSPTPTNLDDSTNDPIIQTITISSTERYRSIGTQTEVKLPAFDLVTENETKPKAAPLNRILVEFASDAETLIAKMPVGTNFENSALKASFSLSSLQPSTGLEGHEQLTGARLKNERLYHSLTKKRKEPKPESWRRSWGSAAENKDDFWSALQANYDYIMDNHLIDSCQEINQDVTGCDTTDGSCSTSWTLNQFVQHFSELYTFLNDIQEAVYGKTENVTNWTLRASYMEELSRVSARRTLFNEQAEKLCAESPSLQGEVNWRVKHINSKWEQVENALSSNGCSRCEQDSCPDVEHEVRCFRKWVKDMEARLQPLNFQIEWTLPELEKKALEHMVLQREIENHSKIVSSVVRLCARGVPREARCHASNARRVASGLERRYHLLFLRSLEWQCHIETLVKLHTNKKEEVSSDCDSDEEPRSKQPRLSDDYSGIESLSEDDEEDLMNYTDCETDLGSSMSVSVVKMVNENGIENGIGTSDQNDYERNNLKKEPKSDASVGNEHKKNEKLSNTNGYLPSPKNKNHKENNTLHKLTVAVDLIGDANNGHVANVGSYYFKHRDTDSELDTMDSLKSNEQLEDARHKDESTEDEFTYSAGVPSSSPIKMKTNETDNESPTIESIQLLVQKADELIATPNRIDPCMFQTENQKHKLSRVKEWLNFDGEEKPSDSCDASGECTSGESDDERDSHSQSSEDLNESIVTCRPQVLNNSFSLDHSNSSATLDIIDVSASSEFTKVNLRPRRLPMKGNRPWSVSCLSQLSQTSPIKCNGNGLPNFSISESALNKIAMSPAASANNIGHHANSASSTVEEGIMTINEGTRPVSLRKKKLRLRRKHIVRKPESGSESHQSQRSPAHPSSPPARKSYGANALVKSGSFSGCSSSRSAQQERATCSDPACRPYNRAKAKGDTSTTSGADSEDDSRIQRLPNFIVGVRAGIVKGYCSVIKNSLQRDSSPDKSSLNTAEEQSSSFSEQAWDNYQEKYLSENYSEAHDSDAARRLLEFGEDYRSYLDSQSDCWSNNSVKHEYSPRRKQQPMLFPDSDSEIEDVKNLINESKAQLSYTSDIYKKHLAMGLGEFLLSSDCGEIIATCERHIYGLEVIIDANDDTKVLPDIEVLEVKALMSAWMDLKWSSKKMQSSRALHNEMITFKKELLQHAAAIQEANREVTSKEELIEEIARLTDIQSSLQDKKRRLLELNVAVHRYIVNEDTPGYTNLKSEVSELYTLWNDTCQSVGERVSSLNVHLQAWAQLEHRLDELQLDLSRDQHTLQMLDSALQSGQVSLDVASSVRDVAKLLSESSHDNNLKQLPDTGDDIFNGGIRTLSLSLLTEGSYSDSGISDEGSEQELSEREHRLAAIRRLVRQLEAIMAPDSEARIKMTQRLEEAESELKKLQSQCRGLIVRTAVCAEVQSRGGSHNLKIPSSLASNSKIVLSPSSVCCSGDGDGDGEPEDSAGSWFRRIMKASVPFQVALLALFFVACYLEPSCCDSLNNLNLSLAPQLRYVRGPPPV